MSYTLKEKLQIIIGTHPDTYPKTSKFQDLSKDEQKAANLEAAQDQKKQNKVICKN